MVGLGIAKRKASSEWLGPGRAKTDHNLCNLPCCFHDDDDNDHCHGGSSFLRWQ